MKEFAIDRIDSFKGLVINLPYPTLKTNKKLPVTM